MGPASSPYEQPQRWPTPSFIYYPADNRRTFKQYSLKIRGPEWATISIPFTDIPDSSRVAYRRGRRYILHPMRYFRQPSTSYTVGHCDHDACNDPHCIETQYRQYDWRDDLRHHEDQDKNGNMRDGDEVGEHCPPTVHEVEENDDDDEDDNFYPRTTHHTGLNSVPYQTTGRYHATPRYEPFSVSNASPSTARPLLSAPYPVSAYAGSSHSAASAQPYIYSQPTPYQPHYTP